MKSLKTFTTLLVLWFLVAACGTKPDSKNAASDAENNTPSQTANNETQPVKKKETSKDMSNHPGKTVYNQHCLPCHQTEANGVPGMYPPLTGTRMVQGDKEELIGIVLFGLEGEIEVKGEIYNTIMAPLPYLSNREVADVLTYVRQSFGNDASEITPDEVARVRAACDS